MMSLVKKKTMINSVSTLYAYQSQI